MAVFQKVLLCVLVLFTTAACGVRGNPKPPKKNLFLGQGYPTFKSPRDAQVPSGLPPVLKNEEKTEEESSEDKEEE